MDELQELREETSVMQPRRGQVWLVKNTFYKVIIAQHTNVFYMKFSMGDPFDGRVYRISLAKWASKVWGGVLTSPSERWATKRLNDATEEVHP